VDFEHRTIRVVETLQRIRGQGLQTGTPKSEAGRRAVGLTESAIRLLHSIRGRQQLMAEELRDMFSTTGYVVTDYLGNKLDSNRLTREFHKLVVEHELPYLTFHGLRHCHVSLLLNDGANMRLISERLGHSQVSLTLQVYSHLLPGAQLTAMARLDKQLGW